MGPEKARAPSGPSRNVDNMSVSFICLDYLATLYMKTGLCKEVFHTDERISQCLDEIEFRKKKKLPTMFELSYCMPIIVTKLCGELVERRIIRK